MTNYVYVNGEYFPKDEAKISVFDHGYLYGDGIFEGIRAYNNRVFKFEEHIDRLYMSAKVLMLEIGLTKDEMKNKVLETLRKNGLREAYVRLIVSRGLGDLGLDPRKCKKPTIVIITDKISLYPPELYETGLSIVTLATRKNIPEALNPKVKSLNYLNNILGKIEANLAGAAEGVMLNQEGYVAECTADNIFVVYKRMGNIYVSTPPAHVGALEGITRNTILEIAPKLGYVPERKIFTRHALYNADEVFLTGTAAEIAPIIAIDGRVIGDGKPGPVTKQLLTAFRELTMTEGTKIMPD